MKVTSTRLEGVYIIDNFYVSDKRGDFIKTFNESKFLEYGLSVRFKESYYSVSNNNVVRGLHFQVPPDDHEKLVYVANGSVIDVILDVRRKSDTYGEFITVELNDTNRRSVYIPKGFAHGFKATSDNTVMVYNVSTEYNAESDSGVNYKSISYDWGDDLIISERDQNLEFLDVFSNSNPFRGYYG